MILYNVTINIDKDVHEDWLNWMRTIHIPAVMQTGCFLESKLSRIQGEEDGGITFSVMYLCPSETKYDEYTAMFAPSLQKEHLERYAGKFAAVRTILTVIDQFESHVG